MEASINEGVQNVLQLPRNPKPFSETSPYFAVLSVCVCVIGFDLQI